MSGCNMAGHAERGCAGFTESQKLHIDLMQAGHGVSTVPGPSDAELLDEIRLDRELMLDEFHGRDPEY